MSIVCTGVATAAVGYFGIKYLNLKRKQEADNNELNFIKFLVIESDCVPKAKQNAENKLARKETKIKEIVGTLEKFPGKTDLRKALVKHEKEAAVLRFQLDKTTKLQELIDADEIIYTK